MLDSLIDVIAVNMQQIDEVKVLPEGFEYQGESYPSLSARPPESLNRPTS
jgi:hypothetical protein